jgi:hypothetical protein
MKTSPARHARFCGGTAVKRKSSEAERRVWCETARAYCSFLINHTRITREGAEACKKPIGLVSLIDEKRQWFKSVHDPGAVLGGARETPREHAFCNHAIQQVSSAAAPGLACRWIYLCKRAHLRRRTRLILSPPPPPAPPPSPPLS